MPKANVQRSTLKVGETAHKDAPHHITYHVSRITYHVSRITHHASRITRHRPRGKGCRRGRQPVWRRSLTAVSAAVTITIPVMATVVAAANIDRTIMPSTGYPNAAGRAIRPATGRPNVIHVRTGRDRLNHGLGRGRTNNRCRDDDRQRQPHRDAEADSGVGRHGSHAEQRGHEHDFRFHSFFQFSGRHCPCLSRRSSNHLVT